MESFDEKVIGEGHVFYYSGGEGKHEHGVGLLLHTDTINSAMGFHPISSGICTIRLGASPFSITFVQVSAATTDYSDEPLYLGTGMQKFETTYAKTGGTRRLV